MLMECRAASRVFTATVLVCSLCGGAFASDAQNAEGLRMMLGIFGTILEHKRQKDERRLQYQQAQQPQVQPQQQRQTWQQPQQNRPKIRQQMERPVVRSADPVRLAFRARPRSQRLIVQKQLRDLGLYWSTLDGLYGNGTRRAIIAYAQSKKRGVNLSQGVANVLFDELLAAHGAGSASIANARKKSPAARAQLLKVSGPTHLGDEYIQGWATLSGGCTTLKFRSEYRWSPATLEFDIYGAEHVSIKLNGRTLRAQFKQTPKSGRKRPNYWSVEQTVELPRSYVKQGLNSATFCALPMPDVPGQPQDLDDFMLRKIVVFAHGGSLGEILPHSDDKLLVEEDLIGLDKMGLRFARNEIFARHGYRFEAADVREHFAALKWYQPTNKKVTLSSHETQNVALLRRYEFDEHLVARLQPFGANDRGGSPADTSPYTDSAVAKQLLEDVKAFQSKNPGVLDSVLLSRVFLAAEQEVNAGNYLTDNAQFTALVRHTREVTAFVAYEKVLQDKRAATEQAKRKIWLTAWNKNIETAKSRLTADPFSQSSNRLALLLNEYERQPMDGLDSLAIAKRNETLALALERMDIKAVRPELDVLSQAPQSSYAQATVARMYLDDVKAFQQSRPGVLDSVLLSRVYAAAVREVGRGKHLTGEAQFSALVRHTSGITAFVEFEAAQRQERDAKEQMRREELVGLLEANLNAARERLRTDPFSDVSTRLAQLVDKYDEATEGLDSELLAERNEALALALSKLSLKPQRSQFLQAAPVAALAASTNSFRGLVDPTYASAVMDDIKSFVTLNPDVLDPMLVAHLYSAAGHEIASGEFKSPGSSFLKLAKAVGGNAGFVAFHAKRNAVRDRETGRKKAEVRAAHSELLSTLGRRIETDPFSPMANTLAAVVTRNQLPTGELAVSKLQSLLSQLKQEAASVDSSLLESGAPPAKTSALDLRMLADIGPADAVLLVNVSGDAPHAFRDLAGQIRFERKKLRVCAPALNSLPAQHRLFVQAQLSTHLPGHEFVFLDSCSGGYVDVDALLATGANLADGTDLPALEQSTRLLRDKMLARDLLVTEREFRQEVIRRQILSEQYAQDVTDNTRLGFGSIGFTNNSQVGCIADVLELSGHDVAISRTAEAHRFDSAIIADKQAQVSASEAFKQAQRGRCAYVYGSADTLQKIIAASKSAGVAFAMLPVWFSESDITSRKDAVREQARARQAVDGERKAALERANIEAATAAKTAARQKARRQNELRARHGAKVTSLVATINTDLEEVRSAVDRSLQSYNGTEAVVAKYDFWSHYPAWYAERLASGWMHENSVAMPRDYGTARWKGREIEAVVAELRMMMKNPELGEYSETCWLVGFINDSEFRRYRKPLVAQCSEKAAFQTWVGQHQFDTQWDLGVSCAGPKCVGLH
jgi:peptidoglycan hydrolase-like protein with peptidoglycan-binding domain